MNFEKSVFFGHAFKQNIELHAYKNVYIHTGRKIQFQI